MALQRDNPSVQTYVTVLQGVITRLSNDSAACKTWCITLITAVAALSINADNPKLVSLAFIPAALFFLLDSYYLSLERDFRYMYNAFIDRVHDGSVNETEVFQLKPAAGWKHRTAATTMAFVSPSILPFYFFVAVTTAVTYAALT